MRLNWHYDSTEKGEAGAPVVARVETIRDRFAMAALQGFLAAPDHGFIQLQEHATRAYQAADLMIQEREKSTSR